MPKGFIVTKWTEEDGLILELKYPETIQIDLDDMMRVFYAHITGSGKAGNTVVRLEKSQSNVASYFTGMDIQPPRIINLMLELGEDPDIYGDVMIQEMNEKILDYLKRADKDLTYKRAEILEDLKSFLKNQIFYLDRFKNLSKDQRLALIIGSIKGSAILELLRGRARSRKELQQYLEQHLGALISNIDVILDPFIKTGVVKQDWIEGVSDIYLFLLSDVTLLRRPPHKIIEAARKNEPNADIAQKYLGEINAFFSKYQPTAEDNLKIAKILLNPDKYDLITLFKEKSYPISKIPKGMGESSIDLSELIRALEKDNIFRIIRDSRNIEWVFLLTDIVADSFFPEYLVENIRHDHFEDKLNKEIAVKHLELLEKSYIK